MVNYKNLWITLIKKGITKPQFKELVGISSATMTKLNKNEIVSMEVIVRICNNLDCKINDVVEVNNTNKEK